jgi:hypothetical protein
MNNQPMKTCLSCEKNLKGRLDKKFCDDYCRNNFNNHQKAASNNYARNIINALQKNRRILESFLGNQEVVKTTRDRLLVNGFSFHYHTHTLSNRKGNVYTFCFELGYLPLESDLFLVVKRHALA